MIHDKPHKLAGKTVKIKLNVEHPQYVIAGKEFRLEDWWDRVHGKSWMDCVGNPACLIYALRTGMSKLDIPTDNEVVYGKVGMFGHLLHVSELEENDETK